MTPALTVELFGAFRLAWNGETLPAFSQPRLAFLLSYLLLHNDEPVSRQQLAVTFWPDTTDEQARTNLRNLVHRLRSALPGGDSLLVADRHYLTLRTAGALTADTMLFDDALTRAAAARSAGAPPAEIPALRAAIDLYAGPLVPQCYDDWIGDIRAQYGGAALAAVERLVELLEEAGSHRDALTYAQRMVQIDPLHESAYRHLMRLHARVGDRMGVARAYLACKQLLDRELQAPISEETHATYQRCLRLAAEVTQEVSPHPPGAPRGAVRLELTSLIGREQTVERVRSLLGCERLVTLTGLGGVGKTRVAQRVAQLDASRFRDGVVWVDLASVTAPEQAPRVIAAALGLREAAGRTAAERMLEHLPDKQFLLVLDNCEYLVDVLTEWVREVLQTAPELTILVTSQRSLGIAEEARVRVAPLPVPLLRHPATPGPAGPANPCVQLFIERARAALPAFVLTSANAEAVDQICRLLSGIPLAIELAATRVRTLTPQQIATRLEDVFSLLSPAAEAGRPLEAKHSHQKTLRAALDWTHGLLSERERILFRRLGVFAGPFTLEAVESICGGAPLQGREILELQAGLEDKSLVEAEEVGSIMRFRMHEVVRRYAAGKLAESGEAESTGDRHVEYYARFTAQADRKASGPQQAYWLDMMEAKLDNLRAALAWSLEHPRSAELGLLIAGSLPRFWAHRGYAREGLEWTTALVRATDHLPPSSGRAHALRTAGHLSFEQGEYPAARAYYESALAVARAVEHKANIGAIVRGLGAVAHNMGDYATAIVCYEESRQICRELKDPFGEATSLGNLGLAAIQNNDPERGRQYLEHCLAIRRDLGDEIGIAYALHLLADAAWLQRRAGEARRLNEEALALRRRLGDKWGIAYSTDSLGIIAWHEDQFAAAFDLFRESIRLFDELGNRQGQLDTLGHYAAMLAARDRWRDVTVLLAGIAARRAALSVALAPHEQREQDALRAAVSAALDAQVAEEAESLGRSLSLPELAAFALSL